MPTKSSRELFVNMAVRDLEKSQTFFKKLGFEFNSQFTNEQGACMVLSDKAYVMLLTEDFFRTFTKRKLCDTKVQTEGLFAFSATSREEVKKIVQAAVDAGGKPAMDPQDHGFMFSWSFYDLDDHHWEVIWMDPAVVNQ